MRVETTPPYSRTGGERKLVTFFPTPTGNQALREVFFFFCVSDVVGFREHSRDGVPVIGTVPGVFMRIPHPKPLARFLGRRPGFPCGCPPQTAWLMMREREAGVE